ncbi:EAL domain-containing protein [Cupriavidus basilensis]
MPTAPRKRPWKPLHACGARVAVEDFGATAHSLDCLATFRPDQVKPRSSHRQRSDQRERSRGAATPGDCRAWRGRAVTATRVETAAQLHALRACRATSSRATCFRSPSLPAGSTTHKT